MKNLLSKPALPVAVFLALAFASATALAGERGRFDSAEPTADENLIEAGKGGLALTGFGVAAGALHKMTVDGEEAQNLADAEYEMMRTDRRNALNQRRWMLETRNADGSINPEGLERWRLRMKSAAADARYAVEQVKNEVRSPENTEELNRVALDLQRAEAELKKLESFTEGVKPEQFAEALRGKGDEIRSIEANVTKSFSEMEKTGKKLRLNRSLRSGALAGGAFQAFYTAVNLGIYFYDHYYHSEMSAMDSAVAGSRDFRLKVAPLGAYEEPARAAPNAAPAR
jgi:hypothetical protein